VSRGGRPWAPPPGPRHPPAQIVRVFAGPRASLRREAPLAARGLDQLARTEAGCSAAPVVDQLGRPTTVGDPPQSRLGAGDEVSVLLDMNVGDWPIVLDLASLTPAP
jgi:hypothetical protein